MMITILVYSLTIVLGVGMFVYANTLPPYVLAGQPEFIGPSFFPKIVVFLLILLSILLIINRIISKKPEQKEWVNRAELLSIFKAIGLLIVYIFTISYIGFYTTTFLFLNIFFLLFSSKEERKGYFRNYLIICITVPVGLYFLFERLLWVFPPRGLLF